LSSDEADTFAVLMSSLSVDDRDPGTVDLLADPPVMDLVDYFAALPDSRDLRWITHPLAVVLTLCACAVVAGMKSFTAIVGWVADTPLALLHKLYGPYGKPAIAPSKTTIWQLVTNADAATVDAAVGAWLATQAAIDITGGVRASPGPQPATTNPTPCQHHLAEPQRHEVEQAEQQNPPRGILAVDGKRVRGALDTDGNAPHLLAAATHDHGLVLAQIDVHHKTNEIPMFARLLDTINITGMLITADCLHTQRKHACYLNSRDADFVFCVKDNQPKLFAALDALPWHTITVSDTTTSRGHGRNETRTLQVMPVPPGLPFPHVKQVFLIERTVTDLNGTPLSNVAILGVTSLNTTRGTPRLIAQAVRGQWKIEVVHWIRDAIYREDDSKTHTKSGPRVMAALRNLAIGALRLAGRNDIAEATRWAARNMERPFTILGLTP
jgi:predicted transposase YbfD/YdcC